MNKDKSKMEKAYVAATRRKEPEEAAHEKEAPAPKAHEKSKKKKSEAITLTADEWQELEKTKEEAAGLRDKILRIQAEFENTRKRLEKEKADFCRVANEELILEILPVIDNFERALAHVNDNDDGGLAKGVQMIHQQLIAALDKCGVKRFESLGKPFDPEQHHAIATVASSDYEKDIVCEELLPGYMLRDKLIRASTVKISTGKEENQIKE